MYCVHKSYIIYSFIGLICFAVSLNKTGTITTTTILDIIHRPVFYLKHNVSEAVLSPSSGGTYSVGLTT
jgi:nucleoside recognition membrane protein YjiH